jgi:hypothetical protein
MNKFSYPEIQNQTQALNAAKQIAKKFMTAVQNRPDGKMYLPQTKGTGEEIVYGELKLKLSPELSTWFKNQKLTTQKTIVRQTAQIFLADSDEANKFRINNDISNIYVAISPSWNGWTGQQESPYIFFQKTNTDISILRDTTIFLDPKKNSDWEQPSVSRPSTNNFNNCYSRTERSDYGSDDGSHMTPIDDLSVQHSVERSHSCSGGSYASPVQDTLLAKQLNQSSAFKVLAEISALTDVNEADHVRNQILAFIHTIGNNLGYAPAPYAVPIQGNPSEPGTEVEA